MSRLRSRRIFWYIGPPEGGALSYRHILAACALLSIPAAAQQNSATATADAAARIVSALTLAPSTTRMLDFGDIVAGESNGSTITLSASGARSVTSGSASLGNGGSAGEFAVSGEPGSTFAIVLPQSALLTEDSGGPSPATMTLIEFTHSLSSPATLSAAGEQSFTVGATLQVAAGQPLGRYAGSYSVTVSYQ